MAKRYLSLISFTDAVERMKKSAQPPNRTETVLLDVAAGRVTAEPVYAKFSVPGTNVAAMDGLAVHSLGTSAASDQSPVVLHNAVRVNTGQSVKPPHDAVIMIEDVWDEEGRWVIRKPAAPRQYIRPAGEDIKKGDLILPRRHRIRAIDIGALASYGIPFVNVFAVRVGIISTGSELVPLGMLPLPEQSVESNNFFAEAYLSGMGATCTRYPIVPDDPDKIEEQLRQAVRENDLVLLSAGSSAGTTDFTEEILKKTGKLLFHGVGIKPGKPVMMGIVEKVPILGMPGYPVAAQTIVREFAARLLEYWGMAPHPTYSLRAKLAQRLTSELGFDEFVPITAGRVDGKYVVFPLSRGFGVQSALVRSNGYLHVPSSVEGIEIQQEVDVTLFDNPARIDKSPFIVGSQSILLHILADHMIEQGIVLRCCPTGNLGGILALRSGTCHAAAIHLPLLEGHTLPDPFKILKNRPVLRIVIAEQSLGLASRKEIHLSDIREIPILNTERGTANRTLLDALLAIKNIPVSFVKGYAEEVKNPEVLASRVANFNADTAMCTQASARSAGLLFLPVGTDSYELVIRQETREDPGVDALIRSIQSSSFKERLSDLKDYRTDKTGIIYH